MLFYVFFKKYGLSVGKWLELIDAVGMGIAFFTAACGMGSHAIAKAEREMQTSERSATGKSGRRAEQSECGVLRDFFPASSAVVLFSRAGDRLFLLSGLRERHLWVEWLKHSGLRHSSIPILLSTCLQQMVRGHKWTPTKFSRFTSRMPGRHFDSLPKLNSRRAVCLHETRQALPCAHGNISSRALTRTFSFFYLTSGCFAKMWAC